YEGESMQYSNAGRDVLDVPVPISEEPAALRDVVQIDLLQVVGFLAMETADQHYEAGIRDDQVRVFRKIRPLTPDCLVRGQFHGYRAEKNVAPDSTVETFAAMRLHIDSWRWEGVPFLIRAGTELATTATEVIVWFKRPPVMMLARGKTNYVRFRLGPAVEIASGAGG